MRTVAAGSVVLALLAAACGGGDDDADVGTTTTTEVEPTGTTAPEPPAAPAALRASVERSPVDPDAPVGALTAGINDAGFDLLRTLPVGDNVVFSPASIGHSLLMARGAADPTTRQAIDAAFGFDEGVAPHRAWNAVDRQIDASQSDDVIVRFADRIWPRADIEPDQAWVDLLAAEHGADVVPLDLARDPAASRDVINEWVAERTEGLIPELLPDGMVQPTTAMVLTDAWYLEAKWRTTFGKYGTAAGTFTTLDGGQVETEFMRELELADRRGAGEGFVAAEIPYRGDELSMLVIVPDEGRFEELRERLDQTFLDDVDATFTTGPYELLLPKWDDSYAIDLAAWLTGIGAAPGSYPGIGEGVVLDAAVHAADIAVDEHGTVAAAATGLGFEDSGPPEPELVVAADRPFVYLIRHRPTGLVLFAGQVTDPS